METENARKLLERASMLKDELNKRNRRPVGGPEFDKMIVNLGNPRLAEKLRIHKLVESQFNKIEEEVKLEVSRKMKQKKEIRKNNINSYKAIQAIDKSKDFRQKETKRKLNFAKQNESVIFPEVKGRFVSFKEHIEQQKENKINEFKFEVLEKKVQQTSKSPLIVKNISRKNMGSYKIEHRDLRENNKPKLSCHVLPSVNIRPALVVENIPGLQFIGNQRKPNTKIRVEHVVEREELQSEEDPAERSEVRSKIDDLSVTDSTTSKFEKIEKLVQQNLDKSPRKPISKFVTLEEFKTLETNMLRDKVKEILTKKLEKQQLDKETKLNSGGESDRKEEVEPLTIAPSEPAQDVPELGLNTEEEEAKSADKYSTTFESDEELGNSVKTVSDTGDNIPDTPEEKTEASSLETDGEPDHVEAVDVEPAPQPPDSEYQQKMLSTIEEVTTVADTEDNEEDYSDNFVSSNISSNLDQAQGSETTDTESNDVTELESKAVDKMDGEDKLGKEDKLETTEKLVTVDKIDAANEIDVVDVDTMDQTSKVVQNDTEDNLDKSGTVNELDIADEENSVDKIDKMGEVGQIDTSGKVDLVEMVEEVKTEDSLEEIQNQIEPLVEESVRDDTNNDIETSKLESVTEDGDVSVKEESDVFVPLPLELTLEDSLTRDQDTEEHISQHDVVGEEDNGDLGEDVHDGLDEDLPSINEDTDDNIETGVLSSDDPGLENKSEGIEVTETVEGEVKVDPEDVDILKLDIETGFLTPERLDTTGVEDPGLRLSPSLQPDLTLPGETDQDQVTSAVTDTDHVRISEGEVVIKISDTSEEGEVSAGDTLETGEASEETSEGELSRLSRGEARRGRRLVSRPEILETSSSSSGWSEGEWRASPGRMRRFLNMAAAFRMIKESD